MKYRIFFLSIIFLICSLPSYSQTEKGNWLVGGLGNFKLSKFEQVNVYSLTGSVKGGNFINKNFNVGLSFETEYNRSHGKNMLFSNESYSDNSFNVYARYYYVKNKLGVFAEGGFGVSFLNYKTEQQYPFNIILEGNKEVLNIRGGLGLNYFISSNVALELLLSYKRRDDESIFPLLIPKNSYAANVGFIIILPKK